MPILVPGWRCLLGTRRSLEVELRHSQRDGDSKWNCSCAVVVVALNGELVCESVVEHSDRKISKSKNNDTIVDIVKVLSKMRTEPSDLHSFEL